jgi:UDP-N-acetyl-D-mannosaminuronic acid transferase (WecB/TagA/CpsF family)
MTLFHKLSPLSQEEIISSLFSHYKKEKYGIVHYLYFANIIANNLLKDENSEYFSSLQNADFLLPDGIALELFCKKYF